MKGSHLLVLVLMNVVWSASYTAYKSLAATLHTGQIVTLRFTLAALAIAPFWPLLPGASPKGRDFIKTCLMGIAVFVCCPRLQVAALKIGSAGDASILMALEPLITAVAASIFLHEKIPARRWFGSLLGILGVLLLSQFWLPTFKLASIGANLLFVSSFLCELVYSIAGKPILERAGILKTVALSLLAGALTNILIDGPSTYAVLPAITRQAWLLLFYLGFLCTTFGYAIWYVIIKETEVNLVALTIFAQPVFGLAFAVLALGEPLHWGQFWGSLTIILGLSFGLREPASQN